MAYQAPISPKGPTTYAENKERGYNSKAKSLIYGGDEREGTPEHIGKRSVSHKSGNGAPFATYGAEEDKSKNEYQAKAKTKDGAAKPNDATFNSDVYRQQIADNHANMAASKARNYAGSGVFGN